MPVTGEIKICEIPSLILAYITIFKLGTSQMGNVIARDAHCKITMGNDIARDVHS